jgi:hypothetical protein
VALLVVVVVLVVVVAVVGVRLFLRPRAALLCEWRSDGIDGGRRRRALLAR